MKRLFGQKPKSSKSPSQVNPIPTPIPVDQFARAAQLNTSPQDEHWVVVQDHLPGAIVARPHDRSRSASFTSLPPGATLFPPPVPSATNMAMYQHAVPAVPYEGIPQQPDHSLLTSTPNHNNQVLKKKSPPPMHGAAAILRSLDPDQSNMGRGLSPSQESLSLNGETEQDRDPWGAEREYEAENQWERQKDVERGGGRERERERGRERVREYNRDSGRERERDQERDQDRGRERDKDRDKPKEKEKKKGLFGSARDKEKERERSGQAELTRMIGMFLFDLVE